ncbi:2-amino-4-hydroxy-6-hydroxymethyldihydropteridine diphosphokinase [Salinisphaera aquimarina]|uniref:2-amino-4-hydroxy-6-hydroxymethyldihydropteridine pyrophosphokinase n=1 Tax=Salinisphaera aquimarina TaxID=2094031 RepID=A0ABV7EQP3_9GAMM
MSPPATVRVAWIGLGSNLESPADQVDTALSRLAAHADLALLAASPKYRTTPVGGPPGQPDYCNACAAFATACQPLDLLAITQAIERIHGRVRDVRWGPRTLDLDILAVDAMTLCLPELVVPHPRAHERAFVLAPLADIAPALELGAGRRVVDLLAGTGRDGVEPWPAV